MTKVRRSYLGLFFAVVLAMQVWPQKAHAAAGRYDQEIQQQAVKVLSAKDKWKGITASTEDGIVTLEGTVSLYIDKADAGRKVSKISHADGVRNHVQVEGSVPDNELQSKLADKLSYDRIGYGIMFNSLNLKVEDGVVTVGGDVRDYPSRDSAVAIVQTTPGVKDVIDEINVLPTSNFDDDLRIRVARAIYGHATMRKYAMVPQKPIRIIVDNGHITLYGVVDNKMDKQITETQARAVSGAFSVENKLLVAKQK
ncbi:MAG: BON domain-containing protein [Acidobacteria bacterium]|nr:BON domain-containing protein [Acidobacteriota bacterium]